MFQNASFFKMNSLWNHLDQSQSRHQTQPQHLLRFWASNQNPSFLSVLLLRANHTGDLISFHKSRDGWSELPNIFESPMKRPGSCRTTNQERTTGAVWISPRTSTIQVTDAPFTNDVRSTAGSWSLCEGQTVTNPDTTFTIKERYEHVPRMQSTLRNNILNRWVITARLYKTHSWLKHYSFKPNTFLIHLAPSFTELTDVASTSLNTQT